ncbi:MAG: amidohydrolase family protein [Deltaproteobacteria bacterium]|nr:amidohydrolase family protein [Deltaproteobacteria bacterium]
MTHPAPGTNEWLEQVVEDIIDPEREIVDPHHHLWQGGRWFDYMLPELWHDTGSGHNIIKTVFVECHSSYRREGPEHLRPIGETEFVAEIAEQSFQGTEDQAKIAGIVTHANLTLGDMVEEILDGHEAAGRGLFRGIRHAGAREEAPEALMIPGRGDKDLFSREDFRQGVKLLGHRGFTYESWHYHHQIKSYTELAKAVPDTVVILDHFGTPLGVGPYEGKREEIFKQWKLDIAELAQCENVVAKLGGLAMPDNGYGWHLGAVPPTSDEFVAAQKRYYIHTIECFGPDRCMFESNFPVDRLSLSYHVVWNGVKKIAADFSEDEKNMMFSGTATKVYRL